MSLKLNRSSPKQSRFKLAIDGDIIAYSCAAAADGRKWLTPDGMEFRYKKDAVDHCVNNGIKYGTLESVYEPDPIENALHSAKLLIESILEETESTDYIIFLSGETNKRKEEYPDYKANREGLRIPFHHKNIREYLTKYHPHVVTLDGDEADDYMARYGRKPNGCICSLDKDLNQVPGYHYNWMKKELYYVNERQALENLYKQFLIGDMVDNIEGVAWIGEKKADKIISACSDETEMQDCILYLYDGDWQKFEKNLFLLKVG